MEEDDVAASHLKSLECPVCLEVRAGLKMFQCANGHVVCGACVGGIRICPACRVKMPESSPIRCLVAEADIERLLAGRCAHREAGCAFKAAARDQLERHSAACSYRPLTCPRIGCGATIAAESLVGHLTSKHFQPVTDATGVYYTEDKMQAGSIKGYMDHETTD